MSMLAIIVALVAVGGLFLWISGVLAGSRISSANEGDLASLTRNHNELRRSLLGAGERLRKLDERLSEEGAARRAAEEELERAEAELERAAGELGRAEAEMDQAGLEISRLEALLEAAKTETADKPTVPPGPGSPEAPVIAPAPGKAGAKMTMAIGYVRESVPPASAATDSALADLDLERVSHTRTRQALSDAMAKIERLERERPSPPPLPPPAHPGPASSPPPGPGRKGAGFQTVSIAGRGAVVPGVEHDRLRAAYEKLRVEKERLEDERASAPPPPVDSEPERENSEPERENGENEII